MNKKKFLKSAIILSSISPLLAVMACGSSQQNAAQVDWYSQEAQKLADQSARTFEKVDATYLEFSAFPEASLINPQIISALGLILPNTMPEPTLAIPSIFNFFFILNRNADKNTVELEVYNIAGSQAQTGFSANTFFTVTKFGQKLDLLTFADYTASQSDSLIKFNDNKEAVSDTDLKTALSGLVLKALKAQIFNVETSDFTLSDWKTASGQDIPATSNLTITVNQYKTTIQAVDSSAKLSSSKELIITIPELNQLDVSTVQNFTADASAFAGLANKTAVWRDDLETILTDLILKKFQFLKPAVTIDDFEIDFEKNSNGGFLDDYTDLTVSGGVQIDAHVYSVNRNNYLIYENPDLIITIPQLS